MVRKKDSIILDTNLWISFLLTPNYPKLDRLLNENSVSLIFSNELLEEFLEVTARPKLKKFFSKNDLKNIFSQIYLKAEFVEIRSSIKLCRDPKDDFLLSLAKDGNASHLITGDKDLLSLKEIGKTKITTLT